MVISWGLKAFVSQEAFPVKQQAGQVFLPEFGSFLVVILPLPPDVGLLLKVVLCLLLYALLFLEVVVFWRASLVLLPVLPVLSLPLSQIYLGFLKRQPEVLQKGIFEQVRSVSHACPPQLVCPSLPLLPLLGLWTSLSWWCVWEVGVVWVFSEVSWGPGVSEV